MLDLDIGGCVAFGCVERAKSIAGENLKIGDYLDVGWSDLVVCEGEGERGINS